MAKDEIGRRSIVQENLRKSTDFLRRVTTPAGGMGGVTLSYICPWDGTSAKLIYMWSQPPPGALDRQQLLAVEG